MCYCTTIAHTYWWRLPQEVEMSNRFQYQLVSRRVWWIAHTLNTMYYYYWTSYTIIMEHPYLTFKQNVQLRYSPLVTHMHMHAHTCWHTTQHMLHSHKNIYVPHHPLSAMCWCLLFLLPFLQDDSGWPLVERTLANNKQLEYLRLGGCDTFLVNMGKALTKNTSIGTLGPASESLWYLLFPHIHCVHLWMMWQWTLSPSLLSFGSPYTHFPLCCMCVRASPSPLCRHMWWFQAVASCNMLCCTVHCMYKGSPSVSFD